MHDRPDDASRSLLANVNREPRDLRSFLFLGARKATLRVKRDIYGVRAFKRPFSVIPALRPILSPAKRRGTPGRKSTLVADSPKLTRSRSILFETRVRDVPQTNKISHFIRDNRARTCALSKLLINFEFNFTMLIKREIGGSGRCHKNSRCFFSYI